MNDCFIEKAGVVELAGKVSASNHPDVLAARGLDHLGVLHFNAALCEANVCSCYGGKFAMSEDPGRLCVRPRGSDLILDPKCMVEHPFVGGGAHGKGANLGNELRVARVVDVTEREQPL